MEEPKTLKEIVMKTKQVTTLGLFFVDVIDLSKSIFLLSDD